MVLTKPNLVVILVASPLQPENRSFKKKIYYWWTKLMVI